MNKINIKRLISLGIAVILLIITVILSIDFKPYSVGAGTGTSATVTTLKNMNDVIDSYSYFTSQQQNLTAISTDTTEEEPQYKSGSVTESVNLSNSVVQYISSTNHSSEQNAQTTLKRNLSIYYTEDATVYHSEGKLTYSSTLQSYSSSSYSSSSSNTVTNYTIDFIFDMYLSSEKILFKMSRWNYIYLYQKTYEFNDYYNDENDENEIKTDYEGNKVYKDLQELKGKWCDATSVPELAQGLLSINTSNAQTLSELGALVKKYMAKPEGEGYTFENDVYKFDVDFSGELSLDLSNPSRPVFQQQEIFYDSTNISNTSYRQNVYVDAKLVFFDINNTQVKLSAIDAYDLNEWAKEKGYIKEEEAAA